MKINNRGLIYSRMYPELHTIISKTKYLIHKMKREHPIPKDAYAQLRRAYTHLGKLMAEYDDLTYEEESANVQKTNEPL